MPGEYLMIEPLPLYMVKGSIIRYSPGMQSYALLVFNDKRTPDSISRRLRELRDTLTKRQFQLIEISLAPDSSMWHRMVDNDSSTWHQGWLPGGPSSLHIRRLAVPRTPFYVVADSVGRQCYRGSSFHRADTLLRSRFGLNAVKDSVRQDSVSVMPQ